MARMSKDEFLKMIGKSKADKPDGAGGTKGKKGKPDMPPPPPPGFAPKKQKGKKKFVPWSSQGKVKK